MTNGQKDRQTERQTETDRQKDRQTDRQTDRQMDKSDFIECCQTDVKYPKTIKLFFFDF